MLAPDQTARDWDSPCDVVTGDEQREQRVGGDGVDQAQKAEDDGDDDQSDDGVHGLVADAMAHVAPDFGEGQGTVAGEGPDLTGGSGDLVC